MVYISRLDRYILTCVAVPTCMAFAVITFLALANELRERSGHLAAEVLRPFDLVRLGIYFVPSVISYVVPIAFFFGILLGLGRLAQHGEVTAMKASGISLKRLALPVIAMGAALSVASFAVQDWLQPRAIQRAYAVMQEELPARVTINTLRAGVVHKFEDWRVYFHSKDKTGDILFDVDIVRPDEEGRPWVFHAESARLGERDGARVLMMQNGHSVTPDNLRAAFENSYLTVPARTVNTSAKRSRLSRTLSDLFEEEQRLTGEYEATRSYRTGTLLREERHEIADRLSLPFAALAVAFVGAPLSARTSHGTGGSRLHLFTSGLAVILLYYLLRVVLEPSSVRSLTTSILNVWIPNLALIAIGLGLLWRVDRI